MSRVFDPSKAHKLEDPERLKWLPPAEVLQHLALHPNMKVADIGAGTGYFAIPIARTITPGEVFAIDLQTEMLDMLAAKLRASEAPKNISLHQGGAESLPLADASIDLVFLANIWHEFDDLDAVLRELKRVLKHGGRIAILDWRADLASPPGPPQDHRISSAEVNNFLASNGCTVTESANIGQFSHMVLANVS